MRMFVFTLACLGVLGAAPARAQGALKESHRKLLGCFGDAFTLVEDVWRIGPKHVTMLAAQAPAATTPAQKQVLAGMIASAVRVDQDAAFAVARNLDGCIADTIADMQPDETTAMLAAAVRTEVDSAREDADAYLTQYNSAREAIILAVGASAADPRGDELEAYDSFGRRFKARLEEIRKRVDALVTAATPRR